MPRYELTVAALAEDNGRFLFVQERAARRVVLNQPAGHVEDGESPVDAVIREAREETGRAFVPEAVTGFYLWRAPSGRTTLRIAFAGRVGGRDPALELDRAIIRTLWLDGAALAQRAAEHRSPLVQLAVDDFLRGARYPLGILNTLPPGGSAPRTAAV